MNFRKYADKFIELSIIAIIILVPVVFYTRTNDVFEINKLFIMKLFLLAVCAVWIVGMIKDRKILLERTNFDFPVLGYAAACLIASIFTKNIYLSFFGVYEDFEGIFTMLFYVLLYYAVVNNVKKTGTVYKLMTAMLIATFIISAYGLAQNFGWDFVMWNPETYSKERFFSTLGNPNFLAAYLVETIPVIFIMFFMAKTNKKKLMILTVLLAAITVLFLTKSRAGALSFAITAVIILVYALYDSKKAENRLFSSNKAWFIMFGVLIVAMLFVPKVREALSMIFERSKGLVSLNGITLTPRVYIWKSALMMYRDFPVLGTGLDTFQVMFPYYRFPIYWQLEWNGTPEKTHNIFLQVLATQGIFGMSVYLLLFVAFFKKSFNLIFGEKNIFRRYMVFAMFMGIIAYIIQGLFNYTVVAYGIFFWLALAIIINMDSSQKKFYSRDLSGTFISRHSSIAVWTVVLFFIILSVMTTREWMSDMYFKVGNIAGSADKDEIGIPYYEAAVDLNPNSELYWVKYGIAFEKLMRKEDDPQKKLMLIKKAAEIHEKTIAMNPMNGYNYNNLARVYKIYGESIDQSKYNDAVEYYNKAIERDPNNAYFGLDLATIYMNTQQWQKAVDICTGYIKMYPNFAVPYSYMGYMYMLKGKDAVNEAVYYYEQAVDNKQWFRDGATELSTYSNLGIIYVNIGKIDKAAQMFERVVQAKPDYIEGWLNLARLYEMMKKYDGQIKCYEEVLKLNPSDTRASIPLENLKKRLKR
jgi:tetratricopeptide (TPR) repeat protein/O-antigen ligase